MFNRIRDFIAAYKQINKDRINAKARLDSIQLKLKEFKDLNEISSPVELAEYYSSGGAKVSAQPKKKRGVMSKGVSL